MKGLLCDTRIKYDGFGTIAPHHLLVHEKVPWQASLKAFS